jgi:regulator of protease activity HflC (stomatin/prohibitin superfamily)
MHQQVSAERKKRAEVLESEGKRLSAVNVAQGNRESVILESEAAKMKIVNCAEGMFVTW